VIAQEGVDKSLPQLGAQVRKRVRAHWIHEKTERLVQCDIEIVTNTAIELQLATGSCTKEVRDPTRESKQRSRVSEGENARSSSRRPY
jgi:hypothetical protein